MNKYAVILISALLTACGALLVMNLSKINTVSDGISALEVTNGKICQVLSDMGHPIVAKSKAMHGPTMAVAPVKNDKAPVAAAAK